MFESWMTILKRVPNSLLWVYVGGDEAFNGQQFRDKYSADMERDARAADEASKALEAPAKDRNTPLPTSLPPVFASSEFEAQKAAKKAATARAIIANLLAAADDAGVAAKRLVFAHRLPKPQHLSRTRLADLFLDTR